MFIYLKKNITFCESLHKWGELADSFGVKRCTVEYVKLLKTFQRHESMSRLIAFGFSIDSPEQLN